MSPSDVVAAYLFALAFACLCVAAIVNEPSEKPWNRRWWL